MGFQLIIPVLVDGKEVAFKGFDKTPQVKKRTDQVGGGLTQIVERPYVENWSLEFTFNLIENAEISMERLKEWFMRGGIEVGLGASRPVYGQFIVERFGLEDINKVI